MSEKAIRKIQEKKFNGRRYYLHKTYRLKADAKATATTMRNRGFNARVYKSSTGSYRLYLGIK